MKFTRTYEFARFFVGRKKEEIGGIVGVEERRASMDLNGGAKDKQGKGEQGRAGERESRVLEAEKTRWQGLSKKFRIALTPFNLIRDAAERNSEIRACAREKRPRKGLLIERSTSEG